MWPMLLDVKRICYRDEWDVDTLYSADDEVYRRNDSGVPVYYRARRENMGKDPQSETEDWAVPDDFLPGFYYSVHFIDAMDLEEGCYESHPDRTRDARPFPLKATHYGACVSDPSGQWPAEPWIRYRPLPPAYSWTDYSAVTAYEPGQLCFSGDRTWQCLTGATGTTPGSDDSVWVCVPFPSMFLRFAVAYAVAMRMQDDDGRAAAMERSEVELEILAASHIRQTPSRRRVTVRVQ
jgi:hypothetical protein